MKKYATIIIILFTSIASRAQTIQWASEVLEYSSHMVYDKFPEQYVANQILGKPSGVSDNIASPCVWAPKSQNDGAQYIKVAFPQQQLVKQVFVNEDYNGGSISKVILYKTTKEKDEGEVIYQNPNPSGWTNGPDPLRVILDKPMKGQAVKIILATDKVKGYNSVDAIGISDSEKPLKGEINLLKDFISEEPEALTLLNDKHEQLNPVISPDGQQLFYTYELDEDEAKQEIWAAEADGQGNFINPHRVGAPLNVPGRNCSILGISPDGQTALLLNEYHEDGTSSVGISISRKTASGWSFPIKQEIEDFYNDSDFGEYCLSNDQQVMIMAMQRKDGLGSKDLYVSFRKKEINLWTKPLNMGRTLNTAASEISPFLAADGKTLYYGTSGKPGYGKTDMFMTRRLDDTWTNWSEPQNLGEPLNTPGFDAYFSIPAAGDYVYFSRDTKDLDTEADLFRVKINNESKPDPVYLISGTVRDKNTLEPISTQIFYEDLETGITVGVANSDPVDGTFKIVLPKGKSYGYHAEKEGYYAIHENIDLSNVAEYKEVQQDLLMQPVKIDEPIRMNNVFFFRSQPKLLPTSYPELRTVLKMLNENPTMEIKIEGHTDSYGNKNANLELSKQRASAIKDYLIENGIDKDRITTDGYGGSQPIADNDDPLERPKNRRVEFRILKI